ncbi:MAG: HAD-IA family hydrolase [SAR324 cluster bacterium]|nr:HAD-IA family hydrolase [SAR324 cluster bacterium]
MNSFTKITHIIYDMDGLLLDTEPFYTEVTQQIVGRYGKTFDWSIKSKMIGKDARDSARTLVDRLDLPLEPADYLRERNDLLDQLFPKAKALPHAEQLTRHFHQHQIPQAIASSSTQHNFNLKTTLHQEWFSIFNGVVLGDNPAVKQGKPAPDIFLEAARVLDADPKHCLVFEDAPSGMNAALDAGMSVVVVPDPNMDKAVYKNAHQILNSLAEFKPELWQLPAFE